MSKIEKASSQFRSKLYEIIFEAETPAGKLFDVALLVAIVLSVSVVVLESVASIQIEYGTILRQVEWIFTILFTFEYLLRIFCVRRARTYVFSFFGIIDFIAIIPTYLTLVLAGAQSLIVLRAIRLLRVFRVLKLGRYVGEFEVLIKALKASKNKIVVFFMIIMTVTLIMGTIMYLVEGESNGFTSIPKSIYWAIVTMTTVGYGDIAPQTVLGQTLAAFIMILGYAIIVVPTGIFSVELHEAIRSSENTRVCPQCLKEGHQQNSQFCRFCGNPLRD